LWIVLSGVLGRSIPGGVGLVMACQNYKPWKPETLFENNDDGICQSYGWPDICVHHRGNGKCKYGGFPSRKKLYEWRDKHFPGWRKGVPVRPQSKD